MSSPFNQEENIEYIEYGEDIINTTINRPLKRLFENTDHNKETKADVTYVDDQIQQISADGIPKLLSYYYEEVVDSNGEITIPLQTFDKETDTTMLFLEGNLIEESEYEIIDDVISFNTITEQNTIIIMILKNVPIGPDGYINGKVIAVDSLPGNRIEDNSLSEDKLEEDLINLINEIDGMRIMNETIVKGKLDQELQNYLDEINGQRLENDSVGKIKLETNLQEDLHYYRRIYRMEEEPENPVAGDFWLTE